MTSERLQILLDEPSHAYFSGQRLTGKVRLTTEKTIKVKALKLAIKGKGLVWWEEGETRYLSKTKILKHECPLTLPPNYENSLSLHAGSHEYPFEFIVGPNLPTSIEVKDGFVRYWLVAIVDHTGLKRDEKTKVGFTVNKVVDLNQLDEVFLTRYDDDVEKTPCCTSQSIQLTGSVERVAWVPGETIIFNGSAQIRGGKFRQTWLTFSQVSILHCGKSTKENTFQFFKEKRAGPIDYDQWNRIAIKIPPVSPTTENNLIDVRHFIELKVDSGFWNRDVTLTIPIIIGNIPLVSTIPYFQEPERDPSGWSLSSLAGQAAAAPDSPLDRNSKSVEISAVPTWFEEAFGKEEVRKKRHGQTKFLKHYWPRYAYYKATDSSTL